MKESKRKQYLKIKQEFEVYKDYGGKFKSLVSVYIPLI